MRHLPYAFVKWLSWLILRLGFQLTVVGQAHVPRQGPFIVASNHLSYLDPLVVGVACPRRLHFLARADLFHHPLMWLFLRAMEVIPVHRGEADVGAVRAAIAHLRQGDAVALFPEGGRQFSGTLGVAKRGVGLLAMAARAPIVPALVRGTFEALPPHSRRLHRAKIQVAFGPPVAYTTDFASTSAPTTRERQQVLAQAVTEAWHLLETTLHRAAEPR